MLILPNAGHQNKLATTNTGHKIKILRGGVTNNTDWPFYILIYFRKDHLLQAIVHTEIDVNITNVS